MTIDLAKMRAETMALLDGTTPSPWVYSDKDTPGHFWITPEAGYLPPPHYLSVCGACGEDNARLIAAAPALAGTTLRLLDEIERLRGVLSPIVNHAMFHDREYLSQELNEKLDAARAALAEGGPDDR